MKRFTYKAKDKQGNNVTGVVEAATPESAAKLIRSRGLIIVKIQAQGFSLFGDRAKHISPKDVAAWTRQFATMINAGLPITQTLGILRLQSTQAFQTITGQILSDVEDGESLSAALSKHPKVFSTTYIALIKAGETGGLLDKILGRLADNLEKDQEFKGKVRSALIYPVIIVVGMVLVSVIMMIFVVPKLTSLYEEFGAELPLPTKILIGLSRGAIAIWPILVIALIAAIWGFSVYKKTYNGRRAVDAFLLKIPIFGELQKQVILTELTRTLSLMIGAGVAIIEGLNITANVLKNSIISDALLDVVKQVEKGFPIAFSFAKHSEAFPYLLSQMVAVGEETGKMEEVLSKVSNVFEVESDQKVKALTASIEPIVMVVLGLGVAFLVIAIILPIYSLTTQF